MLILRALPVSTRSGNGLLDLYHERLRENWGPGRRMLGAALALPPALTGWSAAERRLLSATVRAEGLSMAARKGVHALLNPAGLPIRRNLLRNKALFARHSAEHLLPVPDTIEGDNPAVEPWLARMHAIITKPSYSSKGRNVLAFQRAANGWESRGRRLSSAALALHIASVLSRGGVAQEKLAPHRDLDLLSPNVLATLRIVTCLDEVGRPEVCVQILRLGAGGPHPVDNFNAGGLAVAIGTDSRCGRALRAGPHGAETTLRHPSTGAPITGHLVPDLGEACRLATRAHASLPVGFTVVGWDVGLSDRGPVLVEGNWNPGTQIVQLVEGVGLDRTRLGELYRYHLERLPAASWREAGPVQW